MKYFVEVAGREREVEVVERLGRLEVTLDGAPVEVDFEEVDRLGQVALRLAERSYAVSIEGGPNDFAVTVAGRPFVVSLEDERERAAHAAERAAGAGGGVVTAVMPGVVAELLVEPGQSVEAGEPILILEAMKMQNEIAAPSAGVVEAVHVTQGEAVPAGAKLVSLGG